VVDATVAKLKHTLAPQLGMRLDNIRSVSHEGNALVLGNLVVSDGGRGSFIVVDKAGRAVSLPDKELMFAGPVKDAA